MHWIDQGMGPTWRRAWQFEPIAEWWKSRSMVAPPFSPAGRQGVAVLQTAGWVTSDRNAGSLCPGRRYHIRFYGDHVSQMPAHVVGASVARFISDYRRCHGGRGPGWAEIAAAAVDPRGVPLFFNPPDARTQRRWLLADGWIRIYRGHLHRGPRGDADAFRSCRKHSAAGLATAS